MQSKFVKQIQKVDPATASDMTLEEVILQNDEALCLTGRCGHIDANRPLANAIRAKFGSGVSRRARDEGRKVVEIARTLYPRHVFHGWNITDDAGKPVPYDADECARILADVEEFTIADLINHFTDPANFREQLTSSDGADLGN